MTRAPAADDGREESYDELGTGDGSQDGLIVRYQPDSGRAERQALRAAEQHAADAGRNPLRIPFAGLARDRAKVRHRAWEVHPTGWFHCKRCGFPARHDRQRILHQDDHAERDRILNIQAGEHDGHEERAADLQDQMTVQREELAEQRLVLNAFLVALGQPTDEALQAAVERVMSSAREINARKES
jgi:hypothetical protein